MWKNFFSNLNVNQEYRNENECHWENDWMFFNRCHLLFGFVCLFLCQLSASHLITSNVNTNALFRCALSAFSLKFRKVWDFCANHFLILNLFWVFVVDMIRNLPHDRSFPVLLPSFDNETDTVDPNTTPKKNMDTKKALLAQFFDGIYVVVTISNTSLLALWYAQFFKKYKKIAWLKKKQKQKIILHYNNKAYIADTISVILRRGPANRLAYFTA